jgi:hypothetical protein
MTAVEEGCMRESRWVRLTVQHRPRRHLLQLDRMPALKQLATNKAFGGELTKYSFEVGPRVTTRLLTSTRRSSAT